MKLKTKIISYVLAVLLIVILAHFFYRSFFDIISNGLIGSVERSQIGQPFQFLKFIFMIVNIVGIILCVYFLIKKSKKFNKTSLAIVVFNFIYSVLAYLWVFNATKIPSLPAEHLMNNMLSLFSGESEDAINPLIEFTIGFASTQLLSEFYRMNMFNSLIMLIPSIIIILIKYKLDAAKEERN